MELRDYWDALRRGRAIIAVSLIVGVVAGILIVTVRAQEYSSVASLYVATEVESDDPDVLSARNAVAQQRVASFVEVLNGNVLATQITDRLGFEVDPGLVTASVVAGTTVIQIEVVASDEQRSREIATEYAEVAPTVVRDLETGAGGYEVNVVVVDRPRNGEPVGRPPVLVVLMITLLGLGVGLLTAVSRWVLRRELGSSPAHEGP